MRPITISEKYSGAPNLSASSAIGGPKRAMRIVPIVPAMNEPIAAMASAGPARPLLRHLVAVETRDDRGRLARQLHQDRGGGAAVLAAVVDAGQHDERGGRLEVERDRQQHRDRRERPDARQHADHRAREHPDEAVHQVLQRKRDVEARDRDWETPLRSTPCQ